MVFLTWWFTNSALVGLALGDVINCYHNKIKQKGGLGSNKFWEHRKNKCEYCRSFQSLYYCKVHCESPMWNMVECVYWTYLIQTLFPPGSCYWIIALRCKIEGIIVLIRISQMLVIIVSSQWFLQYSNYLYYIIFFLNVSTLPFRLRFFLSHN